MVITHRQFLLLSLTYVAFMYFIQPSGLMMDELAHVAQINGLLSGDTTHLSNITTFIYIHKVYAGIFGALGITDPLHFRLLNFVVTFTLIWAVFKVCQSSVHKLNGSFNGLLAAQLFFLPIALPYYPLIYTDIAALLFILLGVFFWQQDKHYGTVACLTLAALIRQPSLVWFGYFATLTAMNQLGEEGLSITVKRILHSGLKAWPYAAAVLAFLVYFYFNQSIALGDKGYHRVTLNVTNIYFMGLVFFLVFWPLLISRSHHILQLLKNKPWIVATWLLVLPVYVISFAVTHDYNAEFLNMFLRNWLLNHIGDSITLKVVSYLVFSYTILAVFTIDFKRAVFRWIYLFLPLSVVAMPLIEQRYYIVGFTLWQLARSPLSGHMELLQLLWMIVGATTLYLGLVYNWFLI